MKIRHTQAQSAISNRSQLKMRRSFSAMIYSLTSHFLEMQKWIFQYGLQRTNLTSGPKAD